ncbi:MAG: DUF3795 domain-containing protein [Endomicrobium sp.]|nr:DUF3795 domain-containing protein [Endomicrobium sp.]
MSNRAYCGLDCDSCDAFIATKNNDDALREKTAKSWSAMNNVEIKPEHINCTGCKSDGVKTFFCSNLCEIRKCNIERKADNCSSCDKYPCEPENNVVTSSKDAKDFIESLKK